MKNLLKIFTISIVLFISFYLKSYAEIVKNVNVQGNERVSKETIIIYGDIKIGADYEASDINLLIKKLYDTKFFSDITAELSNGSLNIDVKENPIINSIVFNGEKTKKFKEAILNLLTLREKSSFVQNYKRSI